MKYTLSGKFDFDDDTFFTGILYKGTSDLELDSYHVSTPVEEMIDLRDTIGTGELVVKYVESSGDANKAEDFYNQASYIQTR